MRCQWIPGDQAAVITDSKRTKEHLRRGSGFKNKHLRFDTHSVTPTSSSPEKSPEYLTPSHTCPNIDLLGAGHFQVGPPHQYHQTGSKTNRHDRPHIHNGILDQGQNRNTTASGSSTVPIGQQTSEKAARPRRVPQLPRRDTRYCQTCSIWT